MSGLAEATTVTALDAGEPQRFTAELCPEWEIWGPQGGYLAAVALRAAGRATGRARPASINAHFVGAGRSGPVTIETSTNRATAVGTSVTTTVTQTSEQGERPLLTALVWGADDALPGLHHQISAPVAVATGPHDLPNVETLMADRHERRPHAFWRNVEQRPLRWIEDWEARTADEPATQCWFRFVDGETFADPWLDACRALVVLDVESWGATMLAHPGELAHFAPTVELTARFLDAARDSAWLFSDAHAPKAAHGLVGAAGTIWTADGRLVATGGSTLLCRPVARRPDRS